MLLDDVVQLSADLRTTRSRTTKTSLVAGLLRRSDPAELEVVAAWLGGGPRQRRTGLGYRSLSVLPTPAEAPTLTVTEVDAALQLLSELGGPGSQARRTGVVREIFSRATGSEQGYLRDLVFENLRQGALDSILLDAIAEAAEVPVADVRRAAMFNPASGEVALAALTGGAPALSGFGLVPGRPVRPMLASSAPDVAGALEKVGVPCLVDRKLDGIRVQVHRDGSQVRVFTRSLDDVTERMTETVQAVRALPVEQVVLDGEVIALDESGRPRPFQETASRTASSRDVATAAGGTPLRVLFFDALHVGGEDLVDLPLRERLARLVEVVPDELRVPRTEVNDVAEGEAFFSATLDAGHEGVVVKDPAGTYEAGRRGTGWVKVKPRHTLDLVVTAVEWGSGRRSGWLSNIHLAARDPDTESLVMLGKTFKGMTDEMLAWQTDRFLALETHRADHIVHVRPEQVVEIAFDGIQTSTRYPGGMALRFARVLRYRDDKRADEADTISTLRRLLR